MPKPLKLRETSNPIGLKFHEVMDSKGIVADYAAVARAFEVATPSVYDWIDHGRISKDGYRQLVIWSERPLDWWFDIPRQQSQSSETPRIQQQTPVYDLKPGAKWPFSTSFDAFRRLSATDQARVDGYIASLVALNLENHAPVDPPQQGRQGP